jgi:hypothetical protein
MISMKKDPVSAMELTVEDMNLGMLNERTIILESANESYNGKAVRIRTLRGREFRSITNKVHVGKDDLAGNFALALEACKIGITTPGIAAKADDLDHDVILQLGGEIISASEPKVEEVEDFSEAQKAKSDS